MQSVHGNNIQPAVVKGRDIYVLSFQRGRFGSAQVLCGNSSIRRGGGDRRGRVCTMPDVMGAFALRTVAMSVTIGSTKYITPTSAGAIRTFTSVACTGGNLTVCAGLCTGIGIRGRQRLRIRYSRSTRRSIGGRIGRVYRRAKAIRCNAPESLVRFITVCLRTGFVIAVRATATFTTGRVILLCLLRRRLLPPVSPGIFVQHLLHLPKGICGGCLHGQRAADQPVAAVFGPAHDLGLSLVLPHGVGGAVLVRVLCHSALLSAWSSAYSKPRAKAPSVARNRSSTSNSSSLSKSA